MRDLTTFLTTLLLLTASTALADNPPDRFTVTTRGTGPDILLIPGLACSTHVWDSAAKHLESHYRLHLIQLAGFAGAPAAANATGPILKPTADALFTYIHSHNLHSPKIIGHSLGGHLALLLAIDHPDSIGPVMIVDSFPFAGTMFSAPNVAAIQPQAAAMRDNMITEPQSTYAQSESQFIQSLVKSPENQQLVTTWAIDSDKSVVARALYDLLTSDLRPQLPTLKTPITLLYPYNKSTGIPLSAVEQLYQENYAALPNKTIVRIDNSDHFIMLDQPDAFLTEVDKFLNR